jgi:DNA-binding CsgD family transcriptional regulator
MPDGGKDQLRWIGELQRRSASPETACRLWNAFHAFDIRAEASKVSMPTLVFHVRGDGMVPFEAGRQLAAMIPNARFVPLESKNHILLPQEKAWSVLRKELDDFLDADEPIETAPSGELSSLTAREAQILDRVARGLNNREIAQLLRISEKTVRNHLTTVFSKLGLASRAQAIVAARKAGLGRD